MIAVLDWDIIIVAAIGAMATITAAIIGGVKTYRASRENTDYMREQFSPNHGTSMRDAVDRIETSISIFKEEWWNFRREDERRWAKHEAHHAEATDEREGEA